MLLAELIYLYILWYCSPYIVLRNAQDVAWQEGIFAALEIRIR